MAFSSTNFPADGFPFTFFQTFTSLLLIDSLRVGYLFRAFVPAANTVIFDVTGCGVGVGVVVGTGVFVGVGVGVGVAVVVGGVTGWVGVGVAVGLTGVTGWVGVGVVGEVTGVTGVSKANIEGEPTIEVKTVGTTRVRARVVALMRVITLLCCNYTLEL